MIARLVLLAALVVGALLIPVSAQGVVPPKDCGKMSVRGKPYQVKGDQMSCTTARRRAKKYIETKSRPVGFTCKNYESKVGRVRFYCNDGAEVYFAIRR